MNGVGKKMKGKESSQQGKVKATIKYIKVPKPKKNERLLITFDQDNLSYETMKRFAKEIIMRDVILIPKNMGFKLSVEKDEGKN